jgi:hypothetical protein
VKRPRIISLICILAYGNIILAFLKVFSPAVKKLGMLMPAIFGTIVAAHFISCVGIWYLKRWGVQLYLLAFFAKVLFFLLFFLLWSNSILDLYFDFIAVLSQNEPQFITC